MPLTSHTQTRPRAGARLLTPIWAMSLLLIACGEGAMPLDEEVVPFGASSTNLPAPWQTQDVGNVALGGSASYSAGTFSVSGSGADIYFSADGFRFVYQPVQGNVTLVARVASQVASSSYAKAGVMVRETLTAGSRHAMMAVEPHHEQFLYRSAPDAATTAVSVGGTGAPYWVQLRRQGNTLTGSISPDGQTWQVVGSTTLALANTVFVGLAVSAQKNGVLSPSRFDHVTVTGSGPGVKWHPGHYVMVSGEGSHAAADVVVNNPEFAGVQLHYYWTDLENGKGAYNFTKLKSFVQYLKSKGKRTMLLVMWQTYHQQTQCVPDYLIQDAEYKGGQSLYFKAGSNVPYRCSPKFWIPAVTDRVIALEKALGQALDSEPYFEGFQRAELSVPKPENDPTYSREAVIAEAKREFGPLAAAFPHSLVSFGASWGDRDDYFFATSAKLGNAGIWGPDVIINRQDPDAMTGTYAYPHYPTYQGRIPLMISDQSTERHDGIDDPFTMEDVWNFMITDKKNLYVSHPVWTGWQSYFKNVQLPFIIKNKGFIANTACPANLVTHGGGCDTR